LLPLIDELSAYELARITGLSSGFFKQVKAQSRRLHPVHWEGLLSSQMAGRGE
jgi:hypothetical protein